jgi:simple sugar transport system ATP-binding protein
MEDVSLIRKGQTHPLLDRVTLSARSCEIVGITGVAGNGLTELEDVISGLKPVSSGKIFYNGDDITHLPVPQLREKGLAYVPSDRRERGSSLGSSVLENMVVTTHHDFLKRGGVFDRKNMESYSTALIRDYFISAKPVVPIGTLSGGNIQKVILARELSKVRDFVLFSEPTWGLDINSSQFVYEKIFEMQRKGIAIILISSNLNEILGIADTIVVMYKGRIVAQKSRSPEITKELIGEYMLGLRDDFRHEEVSKGSIKQ